MSVTFTAHNIRLDSGVETKPELGFLLADHPWCVSAKRILETVFPSDKSRVRVADLGCLEGGYAVEFARMGFQVLGVEVRESNMAACRHVQSGLNLPNLQFVQDNAWNVAKHGPFDAIFCCGLLYQLGYDLTVNGQRERRFSSAWQTGQDVLAVLEKRRRELGQGLAAVPDWTLADLSREYLAQQELLIL
jgi:SAM-dependent methyltransferase